MVPPTTTNHQLHHQTVVTTHQRIVVNGNNDATLAIDNPSAAQHLGSDFTVPSAWRFLTFDGSTNLNRRFQSTAQIGAVVYLFAGETKVKTSASPEAEQVKHMLNDLHSYDIKTDKWTLLDSGSEGGPSPRKGAILLAHGPALYLFGGAGPGVCYNDIWKWDTLTQRWIDLTALCIRKLIASDPFADAPELVSTIEKHLDEGKSAANIAQQLASKRPRDYPVGRAYHCGAVYKDMLVIYGGYGYKNDSDSALWVFDIAKTRWRNLKMQSKLPAPDTSRPTHPGVRFGLVACAYGDNMFIFGGQQQSKLVGAILYCLDLKNFVWQQVATTGSPPSQRTYATGCLVGNRWFMHGGSSADDVFADSHELNLDSLHWHPSTALFSNVTLEGHSSASVSTEMGVSSVLLIGGATGGPFVPKGPMMQCDFVLPEATLSDEVRLEDCLIRPVEASRLYWLMYRQLHSRGYNVFGGSQEDHRLHSVQTELSEVRSKLRILQQQHETLFETNRRLEEQKRDLEQRDKTDSTSSSHLTAATQLFEREMARLKQLSESNKQDLSRMTRKYKELVTREQTTVAHVRIVKESATETQDCFASDFMPELRGLLDQLPYPSSQASHAQTVHKANTVIELAEQVERRLQLVLDSLTPIKTEVSSASPTSRTVEPVTEATTRSSTTSRKQEVVVKSMRSVAKDEGIDVGKTSPVVGLTVGVSSHTDPAMGKLDLGRGSVDRKSSMRSGRASQRVRKSTEERGGGGSVVVVGINCAASCGSGALKLKPLPNPSRSMSTVTSHANNARSVGAGA